MSALGGTNGPLLFAQHLLAAQQVQAMYPPEHPRVSTAVRGLYLHLSRALESQSEVRIAVVDGELVFGDQPMTSSIDVFRSLASLFERQGIGRLIVDEGVRRWEIGALIAALNMPPEELESSGGIEHVLTSQGSEHIRAGAIKLGNDDEQTTVSRSSMLPQAWATYSKGLKTLQRVRQGLTHGNGLAVIDEAAGLAGDLVEVIRRQPDVFLLLHALKQHDDYSFTHSLNVAMLSLTIARHLGLDGERLVEVAMASLLHDIGKELVPDEVLNKPGKLTEEEWEVMQRHSADGAKLLLRTPSATDLSVIVAYEHQLAYEHDNPDHGQWPLHFASHLVCIADVYDALRSNRPYRAAIPPDRAMRIMEQEADKKFDPDLFAGFRKLMGYYPPGTCLRLTDGSIAVSDTANPDDAERPAVLVVRDASGGELEPPRALDLTSEPGLAVECVIDGEAIEVDPLDYV